MDKIENEDMLLWKKIIDATVVEKGGFSYFKDLDMEDEDSIYKKEVWRLYEVCLDRFNRQTPQEVKFKDYKYHLEITLETYVSNVMWGKEVDMIEVYKHVLHLLLEA
jgi:hypothetical protein